MVSLYSCWDLAHILENMVKAVKFIGDICLLFGS